MNTESVRAFYERVNYAGRLTTAVTSASQQFSRASDATLRWEQHRGLSRVCDYIEITGRSLAGAVLIGERALLPLYVVNATHWTHLLVHPAAQLAVGRGAAHVRATALTVNDVVDVRSGAAAFAYLNQVFENAAFYGVVGFVAECIPMAAAAKAESHGHHRLACACVVAATAGRLALTVPRAVVALWAVMDVAVFVVPSVCILLSVDLLASHLVRLLAAMPLSNSELSRSLRAGLNAVRVVAHFPFLVSQSNRPADTLAQTVDEGGPGSHSRVRDRVSAAMARFAGVGSDSEEDIGRACAIADQIVDELRNYCQNFETQDEFRGGVALLTTFMELTYEDAEWQVSQAAATTAQRLEHREVSSASVGPSVAAHI